MAHPFAGHRQKFVEKRRVKTVLRSGGHVHSDAAADKKLFKHLISEHEHGHAKHGGAYAQGGRLDKFARGGRTKPGVRINIINASKEPPPGPLPGPLAGGLPPAPPPGPPPGPPGGGMPPPGLPGALGALGAAAKPPGMKRGGRSGVSTAAKAKRASGGRIGKMRSGKDYGQGSGEGRLEEFHHMRGRA